MSCTPNIGHRKKLVDVFQLSLYWKKKTTATTEHLVAKLPLYFFQLDVVFITLNTSLCCFFHTHHPYTVIVSHFYMSRIFGPCDIVLYFPFSYCSALQNCVSYSFFMSCIFYPCIFDCAVFSCPAFSVALNDWSTKWSVYMTPCCSKLCLVVFSDYN